MLISKSKKIIFITMTFISTATFATGNTFPILSYNEVKHDTSEPLTIIAGKYSLLKRASANKISKKDKKILITTLQPSEDTVEQTTPGTPNHLIQKLSFAGISASDPIDVRVLDDVSGAAGATQYFQHIHSEFAIYDKSSGQTQLGPLSDQAIWKGFGGVCEVANSGGDPQVHYDREANRWVIIKIMSYKNWENRDEDKHYQCVAISTSADARGRYYRYQFSMGDNVDYTKLGIWSDGYYLGLIYGPNKTGVNEDKYWLWSNACVLDRNKMLRGKAATMQCANVIPSGPHGDRTNFLPSDAEGALPPLGTPNYFVILDAKNKAMPFYSFHVNWNDPSQSTFTGPINTSVAPFTLALNEFEDYYDTNVISQPNTDQKIDSVADFINPRLAYRYFNNGEAMLVFNHTVFANDKTPSIRWYQFKLNQQQQLSLQQQGTFRPDATARWVGSMAIDKGGNIALGYSASSSTLYPSMRITGRLLNDPVNQMQDELTVAEGNASTVYDETRSNFYYLDASSMTVDPVDDCTFWYSNAYVRKPNDPTQKFNWATHIAAYKFPNCEK
jgi:hypothetical protein